jgi:hypothetical protein
MVVAYLKVLYQRLPGETEEKYVKPQTRLSADRIS